MWGWTVKIDVCDNLSGRKPHVCGDGPLKDMEELVDQIVNPTYVGMDRSGARLRRSRACKPHVCGDGPDDDVTRLIPLL